MPIVVDGERGECTGVVVNVLGSVTAEVASKLRPRVGGSVEINGKRMVVNRVVREPDCYRINCSSRR